MCRLAGPVASVLVGIAPLQAGVLVANPGVRGDYTTLQAAVNAAASGDTINVLTQTYEEGPFP